MVHECTHTLLNSFFEKKIWIEFVTLRHRASLALSTVDALYLIKISGENSASYDYINKVVDICSRQIQKLLEILS